jgi:hypothetical protein
MQLGEDIWKVPNESWIPIFLLGSDSAFRLRRPPPPKEKVRWEPKTASKRHGARERRDEPTEKASQKSLRGKETYKKQPTPVVGDHQMKNPG